MLPWARETGMGCGREEGEEERERRGMEGGEA
jgi:hypothetical protein